MLGIPTLNQYITNFNPTAALSQEDKAMRNIAYLLQFGVVVAQQSGLRELTSITDFNTTNYRTSFQSTDTVAKEGGLKENFNADAIDFMFNQSALAQFNVSGFVQEIMGKIYPLSDSTEVHETINIFLTKNDIIEQEARIKAIKTLKTNLIFNYTQQTASNENGNLLEYYRGKNGVMQKTNPNNLAKRFEVLISNPDFNRNYVVQNLYPETSLSGELNFKLKNVIMAETNKLYRTAFLEGLNSSIPEVKEFFTDLALGSFMQYGGHFNSDNVSSIVPYEAYIDYTTKSHNELDKMRKEEPTKFKSYLTLVRYASKMYSTTATPITTSIEFLARTNPEKLKTMRLQNSVIKSLITLERSVYSPQSTQASTSVKPIIDTSKEWRGDLESRPVYTAEGVNTMRTNSAKPNEHFGNPFSEAGYGNTIKVDSIKEAVISYKKWLLGEMQGTDGIFKIITKVGDTVVLTFEKELNDIKVKITKFEERGDNYFVEVLYSKGKTYSYLVDGAGQSLNKKISIDFKYGVDKNIESQRQWILNQINQGKLDGATLLYAGKLEARGQGMHPTALAEVVEELRGTQSSTSVKANVILPIGTSGSGKSTFIKSLPQENLVVISPDDMRVEFTGDINNKSKR